MHARDQHTTYIVFIIMVFVSDFCATSKQYVCLPLGGLDIIIQHFACFFYGIMNLSSTVNTRFGGFPECSQVILRESVCDLFFGRGGV